jgi:hypothetical protein
VVRTVTEHVLDVLDDLRRHLEPPSRDTDPVAGAMATIRSSVADTRRGRRRRVRRAAVGIAAIGAFVALPPARAAVADLLGLGGVSIQRAESLPPELADELDLGRPVSIEDAGRLATGPLPLPDVLEDPAQAFAGVPTGAVTLAWSPDGELPEVAGTGVGLLISVWEASLDDRHVIKEVATATTVEHVSVDGASGYFISGAPHAFLYLDEDGNPRPDHTRLAANTLLWSRAGVTYRLESALDLASALAIAASLPG